MGTGPIQQKVSSKAESFYRPELDVLRFFAFFAVFIFHITFREEGFYTQRGVPVGLARLLAAFSAGGNMGVDLFFLLSAYLITTLLLRERESFGTIKLRSFYIRRILRIWPLYFLALGLAVSWSLIAPVDSFPTRYVLAYIFLVGNWMYIYGTPGGPFALLWSVAMEEQFYLTWPSLLRKLNSAKALFIFALGLLFFSITARAYANQHLSLRDGIMAVTLTRLDGIAAGILIAAGLNKRIPRIPLAARMLSFCIGIVIFLFVGGFFTNGLPSVVIRLTAAAIASTFFFFTVIGSSLSPGPLVYLGKISYGLYIYHALCIRIAGYFIGDRMKSFVGYPTFIASSFVVTVVLASLSYRFFEAPFLRLKERFTSVSSRPV